MRYHSKTKTPRKTKRRKEENETIRTSQYPIRNIREYIEKITLIRVIFQMNSLKIILSTTPICYIPFVDVHTH